MRRPMETVQDLIEEAKVRMVWWGLCIFGITYFLSHTSKSMWMNLPISIVILCAFRYLSYEVELRWKVQPIHRQTYLSHLQKRQLPADNLHLSAVLPFPSWKRKLDSPPVEAAVRDFINKVLQDFMVDLWYSSITPDKEALELIRVLIMDAIGTVSWRIKDINLVNLLTRDMVELISNHLDLFRRNKSTIGVEVMETLSLEQIDERLRHHLMVTQELHPALKSAESEYKVLQRLVEGILAIVLDPREAQSPLVRCFSRELLTCLVLEPVMNLASPAYINELIETIFLASKNDDGNRQVGNDDSKAFGVPGSHDHSVPQGNTQNSPFEVKSPACNHPGDMFITTCSEKMPSVHQDAFPEDTGKSLNIKSAEWARSLDAATERRTQVLAPENLENMWTKGKNYRKKAAKLSETMTSHGNAKMTSGIVDNYIQVGAGKEILASMKYLTTDLKDKNPSHLAYALHPNTQSSQMMIIPMDESKVKGRMPTSAGGCSTDGSGCENRPLAISNNNQLRRSSSTSDIKKQHSIDGKLTDKPEELDESRALYYPIDVKQKGNSIMREVSEHVSHSEGSLHVPKLKCKVVGAHFEKIGSNSFAVYSIAVTDAQNMTWYVKRRYSNFERLHRHLKDIRNYTLHLPPKRFLSSSIDDYFVYQRCILLHKYLQDLLSIANIAEQHEVWDFLSASSKNYSFGKSTSVMKTLAVNVDDAMDDIVRQFKGASIGLRRKVVGSPSSPSHSHTASTLRAQKNTFLSYSEQNKSKPGLNFTNTESPQSMSEDDIHDEEGSTDLISGWHSDNELSSKHFPPRVKPSNESRSLVSQRSEQTEKFGTTVLDQDFPSNSLVALDLLDQIGVPPEWSPPNVSVPLLNLVDNIFQLKQRGWLRRQVFWISKQILQLMMEDAIDDWLLRQINWLRKDEVITQGIHWLQDVLWPNGIFFTKLEGNQAKTVSSSGSPTNQKLAPAIGKVPISFEQQLEATRRASDVKKIIFGGAPTTLVSLIGHKQYKRCAKDIYHFIQSTICVKQLAYGMLELLLISVFPELQDMVQDIHKKSHTQPS